MKTLIIAEKPSAAKEYKSALEKKIGTFKSGDRFYENDTHVITWARGHLLRSKHPREYDHFPGWKLDTLPFYPPNGDLDYEVSKEGKSDFDKVKAVMKRSDISTFINGCDPGREGELIFWEMFDFLKLKQPVKRLWCPSMTEDSIVEAFENLKDEAFSFPRRDAAYSRAYADWLLGMNLTIGFSVKANKTLHVGRVQTPTIAILAQRRDEIDKFTPEDYFEVEATFKNTIGEYKGFWYKNQLSNTRFDKKEDAEALVTKMKGKNGTVTKKDVKRAPEGHKRLYSLTTLQQEANRKFGLTADDTLKLAQSLYETHKILSYPRSDSEYIGTDHVKTLSDRLKAINVSPYTTFVGHILASPLKTTKRFVDDKKLTDHHAIIPTEVKPDISRLSADERKVYDLVVKRFLSVFYPDAIYEKTEIITEIEKETFKTSGKIEIDPGWKVVYGAEVDDEEEDKKDGEAKLPIIEKGEVNTLTNTKLHSKKTQPPKHYSEATLLAAMANPKKFLVDKELQDALSDADAGLGTPATRAAVIESIIAKGYVERQKKNIVATDLGMNLIEVCPEELKSPEITAEWERKLNFIQEEKLTKATFMKEIQHYIERNIDDLRKTTLSVQFESDQQGKVIGSCSVCTKDVLERNIKVKGKAMTVWSCASTTKENKCFVLFGEVAKKKISSKIAKQIIEKGKSDVIDGFTKKDGGKFSAALKWDTEKKSVGFDFSKPDSGIKCPLCKEGSVNDVGWGYGCSNYKNGCKFSMGKDMFGKKITLTIVKEVASKKKTKKLDGFVSKAGKEYSAFLVLDEKEKKVKLSFE